MILITVHEIERLILCHVVKYDMLLINVTSQGNNYFGYVVNCHWKVTQFPPVVHFEIVRFLQFTKGMFTKKGNLGCTGGSQEIVLNVNIFVNRFFKISKTTQVISNTSG